MSDTDSANRADAEPVPLDPPLNSQAQPPPDPARDLEEVYMGPCNRALSPINSLGDCTSAAFYSLGLICYGMAMGRLLPASVPLYALMLFVLIESGSSTSWLEYARIFSVVALAAHGYSLSLASVMYLTAMGLIMFVMNEAMVLESNAKKEDL